MLRLRPPDSRRAVGPTRGARQIGFDGIGAIALGMTSGQLEGTGYSASSNTDGCQSFRKGAGLVVTLAPSRDAVVAINAFADPSYRTVDGIGVGSSLAQVQSAYQGQIIELHLDGSFGQGSSGVLVQGSGGWIGFTISDGKVAALKVGDHVHATNDEAGC
ncbi:MAG: hypothetical protein JWO63_1304 [Frankiales bacterium]|nr:hypothetical protein [Frankiales bacterium]